MPGRTDQPNGGDQCIAMGLGAEVGGNGFPSPLHTKGDGNSAAKPKAMRRKRARNLSNSSRPRDPSYKIGGGSRGEE